MGVGMTDEEAAAAIKRAAEKFGQWDGGPQRQKRKPILDRLPFPDTYGPQICARCHGAGWMVDGSKNSNYPDLVKCESCDVVRTSEIARCWKVSSIKADDVKAPSIRTFEPHNAAADALLESAKGFVRKPFGWFTVYGSPGCGKTHITESIARYFLLTNTPTVFITSVYLWEYLGGVARGDHDQTDYAERFRWIRDLPALVIDEMNLEKSTEFVHKTRRTLLDARYKAALDGRGVTVLASNDAPLDWQDAAIGDRALDSRFVAIDAGTTSYRRIKR
jgi:DNA replication protein DnaC